MNDGLARQTGLLAGVLTFLIRDGATVTPAVVAMAGTLGLLTYGLLALGPPLWRRISDVPPSDRPTAPPSAAPES